MCKWAGIKASSSLGLVLIVTCAAGSTTPRMGADTATAPDGADDAVTRGTDQQLGTALAMRVVPPVFAVSARYREIRGHCCCCSIRAHPRRRRAPAHPTKKERGRQTNAGPASLLSEPLTRRRPAAPRTATALREARRPSATRSGVPSRTAAPATPVPRCPCPLPGTGTYPYRPG
jgi:hypothetical protein